MHLLTRALCAAVLLHTGFAHAYDQSIETTGFTLGNYPSGPYQDIALISDTATSASFWLDGIATGFYTATASDYQPWSSEHRSTQDLYDIAVKDGYRITGITVTGKFFGALLPAQWTLPGDAGNDMALGFGAYTGGAPVESNMGHVTDLDGEQAFTLATGPTSLTGQLTLSFNGINDQWAQSIWYRDDISNDEYWLGSAANGGLHDLKMTVQIAAVPEPQAWAMLLAGLGIAGAVARRHAARNLAGSTALA